MEVENALELPGEANPLTEGILIHVLKGAASSNNQQIQSSTKQLQTWETQRHFYVYLQSAFIDSRLPLEVRHIAITQLKSGVDKYWRRTAANAISKEDKDIIRSRLIDSGVSEANSGLALQNALVIAKVVRSEYPNTWPDAIRQVVAILQSSASHGGNRLHLLRSLLIILHIVKDLSTGRLRSTKANLQAAAPELLRAIGSIFADKTEQCLTSLARQDLEESLILQSLEEALMAIKVVRRLIVAGYDFPNRDFEVQQFVDITDGRFQEILKDLYVSTNILSAPIIMLLEKHVLQLAKLHVELAQMHPIAFVLLQGPRRIALYWELISRFGQAYGSKPATFGEIGTDGDVPEDERHALEKVSLRGMLILRACLRLIFAPAHSLRYINDTKRDEEKDQATKVLREQIFTEDAVKQMMEIIVRQYFVFRTSDLREWEDEPDEWEKREDGSGEDYEVSIRSCSEKLFLDLAINYRELVVPPLLSAFHAVAAPGNEDILLKDSIYTAIGLAASVIRDHLDFDSFIISSLAQEVQRRQSGYKLLRRRTAILLSKWISVKISQEVRPVVYDIFRHLLDKSDPLNDQVVRVTAGRQFKDIADDWDFQPEPFLPFAPDILSRLMSLIEEVELPETKMALLNTVSALVERLEHNITPYADRIISLLPPLWEQSGVEHLMKQAILTLLSRLFISMKVAGAQYHPLAFDIIRGAVEPDSDSQLYLLDDALELWSAIVTQTPTPSAPSEVNSALLSLADYLLPTLSLGGEPFRRALEITESYILLAPTHMLADRFVGVFLQALSVDLGSLKPDASGHVTNIIEKLIQAAAALGGVDAVRSLTSKMVISGFFRGLMSGLKNAWEAHQTTGPKAIVNRIEGLVETDYFSLLARLTYASPETLIEALQATPEAAASATLPKEKGLQGIEATMNWLLEEWFSHTEDVSEPSRRKLMCLALTRVLDLHQPFILNRLQSLMSMWTDVLVELTNSADGTVGKTVDCLVYPDSAFDGSALRFEGSEVESPQDERRRVLSRTDPVHRVNLVESVKMAVVHCIQRCGGEECFKQDWLVNVDTEVVAAFGALKIL